MKSTGNYTNWCKKLKVKRIINDREYRHRKKEYRNKDCDSSNGKDFKKILNGIISQKGDK